MRLLLDTHAFLWWVIDDRRLSQASRQMIADDNNDVLVSAASAWEITTKHRTGKLPEADPLADNMIESIALEGFEELPRNRSRSRAGRRACRVRSATPLTGCSSHRRCPLTSSSYQNDPLFDQYGVRRLW